MWAVAGWKKPKSLVSGQKFKIIAVAGPVDAEVATVEGCDAGDSKSFCNRHDAAIHQVEFGRLVLLRYLFDSCQVNLAHRFQTCNLVVEELKERKAGLIVKPTSQCMAYFRQHHIRHEQTLTPIKCEAICASVLAIRIIIQGDQETTIDNDGQGSVRSRG